MQIQQNTLEAQVLDNPLLCFAILIPAKGQNPPNKVQTDELARFQCVWRCCFQLSVLLGQWVYFLKVKLQANLVEKMLQLQCHRAHHRHCQVLLFDTKSILARLGVHFDLELHHRDAAGDNSVFQYLQRELHG